MYWKEVVASLYAWDLLDEGLEHILDVLGRETLTNSVYLVALMHDEKRPLTDFYYPHNPRRKVYWTEDSRAYWIPDPAMYIGCRIQPRPTGNPELQGKDWLQALVSGARARGMTVGAELSHTWVDKERAREELRDCIQQDIYGQLFPQHICPNHPDVRAFGAAMYVELASRYDLDFIQTCLIGFHPGRHQAWAGSPASEPERLAGLTLGGCFCQHCRAAAEKRGIDWEALVARLRWLADGFAASNHRQAFELRLLRASSASAASFLAEVPELYTFLKFRVDSLSDFYHEISSAVHAAHPGVDVRLNHFAQHPELMGLDLHRVSQAVDSVRSSDYSEQSGDPAQMAWKRAYLHNVRRAIGLEKYFLSAVSPRPKATPDLVKQGILVSAQCGADALTIGHYDGAWLNCLRAIKEGIAEAGIIIDRNTPVFHGTSHDG